MASPYPHATAQTTSALPPAQENQAFQPLSSLLKAAADPLRLEILRVLAQSSYGVLELSRIFAIKQSGMSHHLKVLATAELVATRREGNSIYYRRSQPDAAHPNAALINQLFSDIDSHSVSSAVQLQQREVQRERSHASQAFFAENAAKFAQQQDLIASYPVYAQQVTALLDSLVSHYHCALEIGPGAGEFIPTLASKFAKVIAIDNSPAMLQLAQQQVNAAQLPNVHCVLGDTHTAVAQNIQADCIVLNMVLHHTPSPADIFRDLAQVLAPDGVLLVTDLCRHDQQWAKDSCGDLWLGFDPLDLNHWAANAGLTAGQGIYIALRNGFQIQLQHFFKTY